MQIRFSLQVEAVRTAKVAKMVNLDDEMCLSTDGMTTDDDEDEDRTSLNVNIISFSLMTFFFSRKSSWQSSLSFPFLSFSFRVPPSHSSTICPPMDGIR